MNPSEYICLIQEMSNTVQNNNEFDKKENYNRQKSYLEQIIKRICNKPNNSIRSR